MTTALAMYEGVLFELNKHQAPDFDVQDFNFFINSAIEKWKKRELELFEITQKVSDKISVLVKESDPITLNSTNATDVRQATLPGDYRHLVSCLVRLRYKQATPSFSLNANRSDYTKRFTGDNKGNIMDNYYLKPLVSDSDVRIYHRVTGNKLSFLLDTPVFPNPTVVIESVTIEYIKKNDPVQLGNDFSIVVDTPFPEHANREIVEVCATLFLENNESQRLQSHEAINN